MAAAIATTSLGVDPAGPIERLLLLAERFEGTSPVSCLRSKRLTASLRQLLLLLHLTLLLQVEQGQSPLYLPPASSIAPMTTKDEIYPPMEAPLLPPSWVIQVLLKAVVEVVVVPGTATSHPIWRISQHSKCRCRPVTILATRIRLLIVRLVGLTVMPRVQLVLKGLPAKESEGTSH
jgi:hypothetical protein